jgi:hypothetical protein
MATLIVPFPIVGVAVASGTGVAVGAAVFVAARAGDGVAVESGAVLQAARIIARDNTNRTTWLPLIIQK